MSHREITKENFIDTVKGEGIVLVDFWAPWCAPCRAFGPVFERVSDEHPDAVFGKCDTEQEPELASALQIRAIPTLMVFRDNILVYRQSGALPEEALRELVTKVKALDMDEIRREAAEETEEADEAEEEKEEEGS
jgi:thioredoxin 1